MPLETPREKYFHQTHCRDVTKPTASSDNDKNVRAWFSSIVHRPANKIKLDVGDKRHGSKVELLGLSLPSSPRQNEVVEGKLMLRETETISVLTIISGYTESNSTEAAELIARNESYLKLLSEDRECRKHHDAETQTPKISEKSKGCETLDVKTKNSFVNASAWDLYDTYAQVGGEEGFGIKEFQLLIDTAFRSRSVIETETSGDSEWMRMPAEKQMIRLLGTLTFQNSILTVERLLASQSYQKKQALLKKENTNKYDVLEPSLFSYDVKILWTYDNHFPVAVAITALDCNPQNHCLVAAGYGHVRFGDTEDGYVCVWSPKNPSHPERKYHFPESVTTLSFSRNRPNILAACTRSGNIYLIDVSLRKGNIKPFPREKLPSRYGPIWRVQWLNVDGQEKLVVLGEAGVLMLLSLVDEPSSEDNSTLIWAGRKGSMYTVGHCANPLQDVASLDYSTTAATENHPRALPTYSSKRLSGLCFSLVPEGHTCYISTKEGIVVKCRIRTPCKIELELSAHVGPVYSVQHSPATPMIFLTCGADHSLKIWVEHIKEPLLTMFSQLEKTMVCAQWSPIVPTLIATLTSSELSLWDIARKTSEPVSQIRLRLADPPFTTLCFTPDGLSIVVGDEQGHLKLYQLSQLPRQPFLKVEALTVALQSALSRTPHLLYKFNKLIRSDRSKFESKIV